MFRASTVDRLVQVYVRIKFVRVLCTMCRVSRNGSCSSSIRAYQVRTRTVIGLAATAAAAVEVATVAAAI